MTSTEEQALGGEAPPTKVKIFDVDTYVSEPADHLSGTNEPQFASAAQETQGSIAANLASVPDDIKSKRLFDTAPKLLPA